MTRNISFIIPAFNEERFIGPCITSINTALFQYNNDYRHPDIKSEVIVVDDHSTDGTYHQAFIRSGNVIFTIGKGLVKARQTGFEASEYDLVAFIDADNRLPKTWLKEALKYFDDDNVVAVTGPLQFYDMPLWFRGASRLFYKAAQLSHKSKPMIQGGNYIVRRSAMEDIGGFDTRMEFWAEDTRTAIQLTEVGKIVYNPNMYILSSGRRFQQQGIISTTFYYIINYLYMSFLGKPATSKYENFR